MSPIVPLRPALAVVLVAAVTFAVFRLREPTAAPPPVPRAAEAALLARAELGAQVTRVHAIGPGRELIELRIPHATLPLESLDETCLLYRDTELGSTNLVCRGYSAAPPAGPAYK